ncbi:uncharacterized protein snsl [Halyomorpha halys]|uniref:uncharacterized protein snsl n=1 Tax=Halyomorpha halys TaxID=286706 RepID=UPI0006D5161F|nr:uncharacterized protein LOC106688773 [Halyomorpha halys]
MMLRSVSILLLCLGSGYSLFVPEQLPTLLSFIYTNIPPVRKGTDSRVGFGFRLGPNADFQVLFELGPQQNTQPLGSDAGNMGSGSKREVVLEDVKQDITRYWEDSLLKQQNSIGTGPTPEVHNDIVNHLRQLYKPQKLIQNNS